MTRNRKRFVCAATATAVAAWVILYHLVLGRRATPVMLAFYLFDGGLVVYYLAAVGFIRKYTHLTPAPGRVICIVPAFNEEPELLENALAAILGGTVVPDEVHVMDDGSTLLPVNPFPDPRIVWHRQPNGGKRGAQATVLQSLVAAGCRPVARGEQPDEDDPRQVAYVLTVDSDSVPDRRALEYLLQAMNRPQTMAATGMILTRNWRANLLTRIIDLNIGTSCLMIRTSRAVIGAVETTSGALALYRAHVVFDNLADYVKSGTNGDDRRLTCYALMRGDVVVVNEALVHSAMPENARGTYKQRERWGKSAWQALPFTAINLRPKLLLFPTLAIYQWLLLPFMLVWVGHEAYQLGLGHLGQFAWAFGAYMVVRYAETGMYLIDRDGMSRWTRLWHWALLTPAEILVKVLVIYPAKYKSVFKLRDRGWVTRGNAHGSTGKRPLRLLRRRAPQAPGLTQKIILPMGPTILPTVLPLGAPAPAADPSARRTNIITPNTVLASRRQPELEPGGGRRHRPAGQPRSPILFTAVQNRRAHTGEQTPVAPVIPAGTEVTRILPRPGRRPAVAPELEQTAVLPHQRQQ